MENILSNGLSPVIANQVKNFWAKEFGFPAEVFAQPGTTVLTRDTDFNRGKFFHYTIDQRTILRVDPAIESVARHLVSQHGDGVPLTVDHIYRFFGPDKTVFAGGGNNYFLDTNNFTPAVAPVGFIVKQLPPKHDESMRAFFSACSPADLDEVELLMDTPDPVIFGCFTENRMTAYAGLRYWGDTIADIGVLTHPDYRRHGLAKAVVSAISAWCLQNNVVAMYRHRFENLPSGKIPQSLGYSHYITIRALKVV